MTISKKIIQKIVLAALLAWLSPWGPALADMPEILPVRSVPSLPEAKTAATQAPDFDGGGTILRIGKDETGRKLMVIDDRLKYFANGVTFHAKNGGLLAESKFTEGTFVGYFLNKNKEIIQLYLADQ